MKFEIEHDGIRVGHAPVESEVERIHQEDFCQAFGLMPSRKYEVEGGPSLATISRKIREVSSSAAADLQRLVRWAIFNFLAGNADGHAKNLSLLYQGRRVKLAPFYDLVCTRAYKNVDRNLAFRIGSARDPDRITVEDWQRFSNELGVSSKLVRRELERQLGTWESAFDAAMTRWEASKPRSDVNVKIQHSIAKRARALRRSLA